MRVMTFAAGLAAGYVLGTRAGREKYQQIVGAARNLREQPAVAQAESRLKDLAGQVSAKLPTPSADPTTTTTPTPVRSTPKKTTTTPASMPVTAPTTSTL